MRFFFKLVVLILPVTLALSMSSASAATGCAGAPAASAINQYCETFPSSGGSHSSTSGSSSLAKNLPPRVLHRLAGRSNGAAVTNATSSSATTTAASSTATHSGKAHAVKTPRRAGRGTSTQSKTAQQRLLTLPAASIHRIRGPLRAASTSAVSLYSTLLIGLIVIALALTATTLSVARRRRAPGN